MDEQRLERALRQGPPFATRYVPSSLALDPPMVRPSIGLGRLVLVIAMTALLLVGLLGGLVAVGLLQDDDEGASNGWVAFALWDSQPFIGPVDRDIYVVREGQTAQRIVGSGSDSADQICPAFSPDGRRLAHGEADGTADTGYRDAALVISDVDAAGTGTESMRIDIGGRFPPPCANWSADGHRVAFGVPATDPVNPARSAAGSEVWVVTLANQHVDVLPDLLATDLEWSPRGSELAIASGENLRSSGGRLLDGSIRLYDADTGELRTLVGPSGVFSLTWSPDGSQIAYQRGRTSDGEDQEIWVAETDGGEEHVLVSAFSAIHGIGPVWSPTGDYIVYQRMCDAFPDQSCGERHDVVLVTPNGESERVLPPLALPGSDTSAWYPFRVTWSPDGAELLYVAWSYSAQDTERTAVIAAPIDPHSSPVVLHEDARVSVYQGDGAVPVQSWGRRADD